MYKAATIKDIANALSLSTSTVSRALKVNTLFMSLKPAGWTRKFDWNEPSKSEDLVSHSHT